ncbi:MerR family transcriptional regulator [Phreatobacter sp.]|uniref:MerR family transcriptional regulator n=1 Tax=Phreatobacter sp. TaxID=1966341 RepID=UPI003F6E70CD
MTTTKDDGPMMTAAECAGRMGLTVRALRVYERHGLIAPGRTGKNWRLYGAREITRLSEILALKQLGLSLSRIAGILKGRASDLDHLLAVQRAVLVERRDGAERSLALVGSLQAKVASGDRVSIDDLVKLAKDTSMIDDRTQAVAWRRYEQARPRVEIPVEASRLDEYAGDYRFGDGTTYTVTARDGRLFVRVMGQPEVEAFAEADDRFFLKIVPAQVSFDRGADGRVDRLVHHQGGLEQEAVRVAAEDARASEDALAARIRLQQPLPGGEALLRRIVEDQRRGEPDYDAMTPALASLVRQQLAIIVAELGRRGATGEIRFKGVGEHGMDIYEVRFERGATEWGLGLAPDGRISGLYVRPVP